MDIRNDTEIEAVLMSRMYTIKRYNLETGANSSFKFAIAQNDMPKVHIT